MERRGSAGGGRVNRTRRKFKSNRSSVFLTEAERVVLLSCMSHEPSFAPRKSTRRGIKNVTLGTVLSSKFTVTVSLFSFHLLVGSEFCVNVRRKSFR